MNGNNILTEQNQDNLKDKSSSFLKGQVKSSQSKDTNSSPRDILNAFNINNNNKGSSLSKLNQELMNSSFNQLANSTQQLADILFFCRKRLDENSVEYLSKVIPIDYEREEMEQIESLELAQYIKQIINYLSKCKLEMESKMSQLIKPDEEYMNEYEGMLQKMEAECRNHIRIEQQLKIYAETAQERLEFVEKDFLELEKQNEELKYELNKMTQTNEELITLNKSRDEKIEVLKLRIKELEEQIEKQTHSMLQQSTSSLNKTSKIPLHNNNHNRSSIRDSIIENINNQTNQQNGGNYIQDQNAQSGISHQSGVNSHKNNFSNSQNISANPSSNENSSQKHNGLQQQPIHSQNQPQQNKRAKRSVSTLNSQNDENNTQREVMRQLENNGLDKQYNNNNQNNINNTNQYSNRIKTEPYHNLSQQNTTGQNSGNNALKSTSSSHQHSNGQNNQSNTYSQDALAYLLGNSNHKLQSSSSLSNNNRISHNNTNRDDKRIMEKYLFDKGEKPDKTTLKKIYGDSAKSKSFIDLNKSQKNPNSSRGPSSHNKGSQPSSNQSKQQNLIKQIQQQQIMKQVQSQAVLNRIQQKINQTVGQNNGSSKNSNNGNNNSQNNLSNIYPNSNSNTLTQSQTQRALSRSKSRNKFKEYNNNTSDTSRTVKEYNIYTLNPQNAHKVQQAGKSNAFSPQKQKNDTYRSQSVDAYSKGHSKSSNNVAPPLNNYNLK